MKNCNTGRLGFTLIELLVVVLILGILAAVALPQYQVAVAKSRLMQSMVLAKAIKEAEESFYLANNKYTVNPDDLDISVGPYTSRGNDTLTYNTLNNKYEFRLAINGAGGVEDRVEVYFNGNNGITFYFDHGTKKKGLAGTRGCFGDKDIYYKACLSMGGEYLFTSGESTIQFYKLP